jgi:hypothetical protein
VPSGLSWPHQRSRLSPYNSVARLAPARLRYVPQLHQDDAGPQGVAEVPPTVQRLLEDGLGAGPVPQLVRLVAHAVEDEGHQVRRKGVFIERAHLVRRGLGVRRGSLVVPAGAVGEAEHQQAKYTPYVVATVLGQGDGLLRQLPAALSLPLHAGEDRGAVERLYPQRSRGVVARHERAPATPCPR